MEHEGLKNLYEQVISNKFGWDRWGLLSVLSDYVLNYTQGDILEIGCGESSIYFSKLAEKYNRKCYHVEYSKSGVENMKNTKGYFGNNSQVFNMKSNDFFKKLYVKMVRLPRFALVFIDGDHEYEQVKNDFLNSLYYIVNGGYIFLHDTMPPDDSWKVPEKCGTVYKLREEIEEFELHKYFDIPEYESFTFPNSAFNVGLTMIRIK